MAQSDRVTAVVVTYNRKQMLVDCLRALARQTHPPTRVIVVDNASTDGTEAYLADTDASVRAGVSYVRLARNGGGAEGFHYGVKHALRDSCDWLWLMDDDCEPAPDCLERLLGSDAARDARTAVVCPAVVAEDGRLLPLNRLLRRRRLVRSPLVPVPEAAYQEPQVRTDTASFVGPLIRADLARQAGLPIRQTFIRFDDIEYVDRLGGLGGVWTVTRAEITHREPMPLTDVSFAGTLRRFLSPREFAPQWKHLYGVRNLIFAGRRHGWMTLPNALGIGLLNVVLFLILGERRGRLAYLAALYTYDGLTGRFRNLAPSEWPELADAPSARAHLRAHALRYGFDSDAPAGAARRGG